MRAQRRHPPVWLAIGMPGSGPRALDSSKGSTIALPILTAAMLAGVARKALELRRMGSFDGSDPPGIPVEFTEQKWGIPLLVLKRGAGSGAFEAAAQTA